MADFTVGMSDTVALSDSVKLEYETQFIIAANQLNVIDPVVEYNRQIGAKSITMAKYANLTVATTPLTEKEDPDSEAISDSNIVFTPAEYGNVVTTTKLAELQTGGQAGLAAIRLVAGNMAETRNALGTAALEASTNVLYSDGTSRATIAAGDKITPTLLNSVYNKLARASVLAHSSGAYVAFMHDDVIHDLRDGVAAGDWTDVGKYAADIDVLRNEIGMYKGFRIIRNNHCGLLADAGAAVVDVYQSSFMGFNGLGLAESSIPEIKVTGPFDKLGRFMNVGWLNTIQYKIVDSDAVWVMESSSSIGANT